MYNKDFECLTKEQKKTAIESIAKILEILRLIKNTAIWFCIGYTCYSLFKIFFS